MAGIAEVAERTGFRGFDRHHQHGTMSVSDCPAYSVTVRFGKWVKTVESYDMPQVAEFERQPAVPGFQEPWEAIVARAPFERVPTERGPARPWWRVRSRGKGAPPRGHLRGLKTP